MVLTDSLSCELAARVELSPQELNFHERTGRAAASARQVPSCDDPYAQEQRLHAPQTRGVIRVEIITEHEIRAKQVPTTAIQPEFALIQLHCFV